MCGYLALIGLRRPFCSQSDLYFCRDWERDERCRYLLFEGYWEIADFAIAYKSAFYEKCPAPVGSNTFKIPAGN